MYCQVTIRVTKFSKTKDVWFVLRSNHRNIGSIYRSLQENGSFYGHRLETEPMEGKEPGARRVVDEYETIIGREALISIADMQGDLYGEDGKPLWTLAAGEVGGDAEVIGR
ncbi:hypothetical protein [Microcystis phage Mae-JY30]